jgi:type IV pilus assembly protein PilE
MLIIENNQIKGFTLIEIIVALIILSITAAIAVPNYQTYMVQEPAKAAQNNLINIYNAEKQYYLNHGSYCTAACGSLATINATLLTNISDANATYACAVDASGFSCTATSVQDTSFFLTVTNTPITI